MKPRCKRGFGEQAESVDQLVLQGVVSQVAVRRKTHLFHHPRPVGADGLDAEREGLGDVASRFTLGKLEENLELALRQLLVRCHVIGPVQLLGKKLRNRRCDVALSKGNDAYCIDNFSRVALLVEVATGSLTDEVDRVVLFRVTAQNEDANVRCLRTYHRQSVNAALTGHGQIHNQDIQFDIAHKVYGFAATARFTDDAQIHLVGEKLLEPGPHNRVVIHNSNFDHVAVFLGKPALQANGVTQANQPAAHIYFSAYY